MMSRIALQTLLFALPWRIRRSALVFFYNFDIHPTATIGFSWITCEQLSMAEGSRIGHLTLIKGMKALELHRKARIGNGNWITGAQISDSVFKNIDRNPCLIIREHAAITHGHLIDCSDYVEIGAFSTVGGWGSQLLTHSIDIRMGRQTCAPIKLGDYTFIGTRVIILKGAALPSFSVLGAGAVLSEAFSDSYYLYAGTPARPVTALPADAAYFTRETGFVE